MAHAEVTGAPLARERTGKAAKALRAPGRGIIRLSELDTSDVPTGGWLRVGKPQSLVATLDRSYLDHFDTEDGHRDRDDRVTIEQNFSVKFSVDEESEFAAVCWGQAAPIAETNAAEAGFAEQAMVVSVVLGAEYLIIDPTTLNRAYGVTHSKLTVEKSGAPDVALVRGTDYDFDPATGGLLLLRTATHITDGDQLDVTLTADASCDNIRRIDLMERDEVVLAMRFVRINPRTRRKYELYVPKMLVTNDGGWDMISQEWTKISLTGEALKIAGTPLATMRSLPLGSLS